MLNGIESIVKHYKPHLNGERFLSNNEVSKKLNVSLRTLQEWRDIGLIPFIQIKGKIIYRQIDIDKLLQKHYFESWKE
ncbi:helix-turn-helix domain-containing protein, partial [Bacteroides ovatus]